MKLLKEIPITYEWSFADKTRKDTAYITHGYYTYPAKFIPQVAARIIQDYSEEGDIVIDPFMGSGTTVVEALINKRIGIGVDINEIAVLLSKVKTTPIETDLLKRYYDELLSKLDYKISVPNNILEKITLPDRVDYWFKPHIKDQLLVILGHILSVPNKDVQDFFLIAFAQILKSCSIWLQKSVKPTRDKNKKEYDPFLKFRQQSRQMLKRHEEFNKIMLEDGISNIDAFRVVENADARNLPCETGAASLIVTSPPYVTSYEYADLHQLASLWLGYLDELSEFRKKFIGSAYTERENRDLQSPLALQICDNLGDNKKGIGVRNYYADMLESFLEMKRVLKKGGKAAVVIGNTKMRGVEILNAEVFKEQFENIGFETFDIIHREIPSKMLPSTRDPKTGRFTKTTNSKKELVYPTEYIMIMEKL